MTIAAVVSSPYPPRASLRLTIRPFAYRLSSYSITFLQYFTTPPFHKHKAHHERCAWVVRLECAGATLIRWYRKQRTRQPSRSESSTQVFASYDCPHVLF